jgi:AcrR family transcriptional regulator
MELESRYHEPESISGLPPRERIVQAARELFYRHGIRAIGVEAVAEAAGTNKMTLYRHFPSKNDLIVECLRRVAKGVEAFWERLETEASDPRARLHAWVRAMAEDLPQRQQRGCFLANAAVELAERGHPGRSVIEVFKRGQRERLTRLCQAAGLNEAELLAEELFLVIEGARASAQSCGSEGLEARVVRIGEAIIKAHTPPASTPEPAAEQPGSCNGNA